jgi:hypothetical protein
VLTSTSLQVRALGYAAHASLAVNNRLPTGTARLYGTVLDAINGKPTGHVLLVLMDGAAEVGALRTDVRGHFDFDTLTTGEYTLSIRKEGYISEATHVSARSDAPQFLPIFLSSL